LRQVLSFGNLVHPHPALHQRTGYAAQPEIDREPDADRAAAHDDDLISLAQDIPPNPAAGRFTHARSNRCSRARLQLDGFAAKLNADERMPALRLPARRGRDRPGHDRLGILIPFNPST
jgi:hypothetical protein